MVNEQRKQINKINIFSIAKLSPSLYIVICGITFQDLGLPGMHTQSELNIVLLA